MSTHSLRKTVHHLLDSPRPGSLRAYHYVQLVVYSLITLSVLLVILETVPELPEGYREVFWHVELVVVVFFSIEYLARLWSCVETKPGESPVKARLRYVFSFYGLIDLIAILPFFLHAFLPVDLLALRVMRYFRLFRILKLSRYSKSIKLLTTVFREKKEPLIVAMSILVALLIISSTLMYFAEHQTQPEVFSSIPAAMWWAVATLTTVGYGDVYPVTALGKCIASVIAVLGIGFFALPAGILSSGFTEKIEKTDETAGVCPHCGKGK
jgi:voltage-gated potassium channel